MAFEFKVYQAKNPSTPAYTYLGKSTNAGVFGAQTSKFPHQTQKNCHDVFIFATIIGGKNIKITPATETDPYIYLDTRWYNFDSSIKTNPQTNTYEIFKGIEKNDNKFTLTVKFKTLTSDGSVLIKSNAKSSFFWDGKQNIIDPDFTDNIGCDDNNITDDNGNIVIKRRDYTLKDNPISDPLWNKRSVSLIDDKVIDNELYTAKLMLKSLIGSECIKVEKTDRGTIKISFDNNNCQRGCFKFTSSESSSSSSSSSVDLGHGLSSECP
jgi:hypothetical protein